MFGFKVHVFTGQTLASTGEPLFAGVNRNVEDRRYRSVGKLFPQRKTEDFLFWWPKTSKSIMHSTQLFILNDLQIHSRNRLDSDRV